VTLSLLQEPPPAAQLWTASCAPKSAEEVLGGQNRQNAIYLRDWLSALALKAASEAAPRAKVKRAVDSKKGKRRRKDDDSDLDDFIVSDGEADFDAMDGSSPVKAASTSSAATRFSSLTNLILLQGPHSSGKTSTVYALAKELGWQVHEVNPGSTRRAYKELMAAVGEVGRNHTMTKRETASKPAAGPFAAMFQTKTKDKAAASVKTNGAGGSGTKGKQVEQSVILIEEVDVLFAADKSAESFWDGAWHCG
jgi:hypothetical protein